LLPFGWPVGQVAVSALQRTPLCGSNVSSIWPETSERLTRLKSADFAMHLSETAKTVDGVLMGLFGAQPLPGETLRPQRVIESMRYAALAGGKRLRPFLV